MIFGLTRAVFAFADPDVTIHSPLPVTLSSEPRGFSVKAEALYLQPHATGGNESGIQLPATNTTLNASLDPGYAWGFKVQAGRQLEDGFGFYLNWYHLNTVYHSALAPFISGQGNDVLSTSSRLAPSWDSAFFELGREVDFSHFATLRFYSGLQYTRIFIGQTMQQTYSDTSGLVANTQTLDRLFNGFGGRFGLGTTHHWGNGFHTFVNAATAVLAGSHSQNVLNTNPTIVTTTPTSFVSKSAIVPEIEAEAGASYSYFIQQGLFKGHLSANLGWIWINYVSALLHVSYAPATSSISDTEFNFGVQGPRLGLTWRSV